MNAINSNKPLSRLQVDILRVLWQKGEATVTEVQAELRDRRGLASTTVATILSRLEKAGAVEHRNQGRQYVYRPRLSENDARRSMVAELVEKLFHGDPSALVNHLLDESDFESGDLEKVRALIETSGDDLT